MKKEQKIEILAPAGSYECFHAAIQAGADAVYAAGARLEPVHMLTTFHRMSCSVRSGRLISMTGDFILL